MNTASDCQVERFEQKSTEKPSVGLPTVQLLHVLPDGSQHIDWMIGRDIAGTQPLITFRLTVRLDDPGPTRSRFAERIEDHRPVYLHYEGAISGDGGNRGHRGQVRRVSRGRVWMLVQTDQRWEMTIQWEGRSSGICQQVILLRDADSSRWQVEYLTQDAVSR